MVSSKMEKNKAGENLSICFQVSFMKENLKKTEFKEQGKSHILMEVNMKDSF